MELTVRKEIILDNSNFSNLKVKIINDYCVFVKYRRYIDGSIEYNIFYEQYFEEKIQLVEINDRCYYSISFGNGEVITYNPIEELRNYKKDLEPQVLYNGEDDENDEIYFNNSYCGEIVIYDNVATYYNNVMIDGNFLLSHCKVDRNGDYERFIFSNTGYIHDFNGYIRIQYDGLFSDINYMFQYGGLVYGVNNNAVYIHEGYNLKMIYYSVVEFLNGICFKGILYLEQENGIKVFRVCRGKLKQLTCEIMFTKFAMSISGKAIALLSENGVSYKLKGRKFTEYPDGLDSFVFKPSRSTKRAI